MALQGATHSRYDPENLLIVAEFLGQGAKHAPDARQKTLRLAAEKLARLLAFAETQPESWKLLIQFIGEKVQEYVNQCAGIDPLAEPAKTHGYQCFKAGGAKALVDLAHSLLPTAIQKRLDKTLSMCETGKEDIPYAQ